MRHLDSRSDEMLRWCGLFCMVIIISTCSLNLPGSRIDTATSPGRSALSILNRDKGQFAERFSLERENSHLILNEQGATRLDVTTLRLPGAPEQLQFAYILAMREWFHGEGDKPDVQAAVEEVAQEDLLDGRLDWTGPFEWLIQQRLCKGQEGPHPLVQTAFDANPAGSAENYLLMYHYLLAALREGRKTRVLALVDEHGQRALAGRPIEKEVFLGVGARYAEMLETAKEVDAYLMGLEIFPGSEEIRARLAGAYSHSQDFEAALEQYEILRNSCPENPEYRLLYEATEKQLLLDTPHPPGKSK